MYISTDDQWKRPADTEEETHSTPSTNNNSHITIFPSLRGPLVLTASPASEPFHKYTPTPWVLGIQALVKKQLCGK